MSSKPPWRTSLSAFSTTVQPDSCKDRSESFKNAKKYVVYTETENHTEQIGREPEATEGTTAAVPKNALVAAFEGRGPLSSHLNGAIAAGRIAEVESLLQLPETNPNAISLRHFSRASCMFLRFRPDSIPADADFSCFPTREELFSNHTNYQFAYDQFAYKYPEWAAWSDDDSLTSQQAGPLTYGELTERRTGRSRFWAEKRFPRIKTRKDGRPRVPITAMELAARCGQAKVLQSLNNAGANTRAWLKTNARPADEEIPLPGSYSLLSISTPLHGAVDARNAETLSLLLRTGHDPSFFPPAIITRSLSATMHAISQAQSSSETSSSQDDDVWPLGLKMLLAETNFTRLTPVFKCHCLHIAAATLDLGVFLKVLEAACGQDPNLLEQEPTVLGHTPLHVACMPLDDTMINLHSRAIHCSIHDVRTLDEAWEPCVMRPVSDSAIPKPGAGARETIGFLGSRGGIYSSMLGDYTSEYAETPAAVLEAISRRVDAEHEAQYQLVKFLLAVCYVRDPLAALMSQDIHGNTPWHYLASYRDFNVPLWTYLEERALGLDNSVLNIIKNDWGFTAPFLADCNKRTRPSIYKLEGYWPFWDYVISGGRDPKCE